MSFNRWMIKQVVMHPDHGILFSNKNEWTLDIHSYLDESLENYSEWKGPILKGHILYDSIPFQNILFFSFLA